MSRILILDIETIVDRAVWTPPAAPAPWALDARTHTTSVEDLLARRPPDFALRGTVTPPPKDDFPPPFAWHPIVVGCVLLEREGSSVKVVRVGAIEGLADDDLVARERTVLRRFSDFVGDHAPLVVTWNGRGFDLPVLMLRSMRAGIPQSWYYGSRDTRYRFSEEGHCDLCDAMSDYGSTPRLHLDGMAKLIGLPGKYGDVDGAGVAAAFEAGRLKDIARYCVSDALQTAFLWLRWQHLKGVLALEGYREAAEALLAASAETVPEFAGLVDRKVLLLEGEGA